MKRRPDATRLLTALLLVGSVLLLALLTELFGPRLFERIVVNLFVTMTLVVGLQVFMGNSGILNFAHVGFMGVGAYTSALLTIPVRMKGMALPDLYPLLAEVELAPWLGMLGGALFAALVAAAITWPLVRLSDAAAVITLFALLVVLHTFMLHWSAVTNGPRTLFGLPRATDLPLAAGVAAGAVLLALAFRDSRVGLLLRATRDDRVAAAGLGARVPRLRWYAFVLSAFLAGLGGALWGHFITSFSPKSFYLHEAFVVLAMLVIGGPGTVTGAVFGTYAVTAAFELLRAVENRLNRADIFTEQVVGLTEVVLALAMIAVLALRPGGLFPGREIGALLLRHGSGRKET